MITHFTIHVTGEVQGVSYRTSTKDKAIALGVNGLVRNEPDMSKLKGMKPNLMNSMAWCNQGSPRAEVIKVRVKESAVGFVKFVIER